MESDLKLPFFSRKRTNDSGHILFIFLIISLYYNEEYVKLEQIGPHLSVENFQVSDRIGPTILHDFEKKIFVLFLFFFICRSEKE